MHKQTPPVSVSRGENMARRALPLLPHSFHLRGARDPPLVLDFHGITTPHDIRIVKSGFYGDWYDAMKVKKCQVR